MALQLDITTLVLMFITLGMTSFIVMLLIWRINRNMPGVLYWMVGTFLNIASALATLLDVQYGWSDGWGPFLSTTTSLAANLLVLEGALQFRGFTSRRRGQLLLALFPVFILATWATRPDPFAQSILEDGTTMILQLLAGAVLVWRTAGRHELQANLLAATASVLIGLTIAWRLALTLSGSAPAVPGDSATASQWYLFAGANFHVAWIFGLSVACYFRSRQQEMLLAREDSLTRLPNRRWVDERLAQTLKEAQRSGDRFALVMLDINNFKQVNDRLGHSAGDSVLTELAVRLRRAVRESDFAGRLGGDEFIILTRHIETDSLLTQMLERLRQRLDGQMTLNGTDLSISVSIGAAVFPADGNSLDALLRAADESMYRDKNKLKHASAGSPAGGG